MPLVTTQQFPTPSILEGVQSGLDVRGEIQRQERLTQADINQAKLAEIAAAKAARNLATQQRALGVSTEPVTDEAGKISETQEAAQRRMIAENPDEAKKILDNIGVHTQQGLEELARFSHTMRDKSPEEQVHLIKARIKKVEARGGDASQTKRLLLTGDDGEPVEDESGNFTLNPKLTPKALDSAMVNSNEAALTAWQRTQLEEDKKTETTTTAKVQSSEILPDGSTILVMNDGTTKVETLEDTAKRQVKTARKYGAEIQGLRSGERESGKGAIKIGHDAFKKLTPIRKGINNLRRAVKLLDEGAETGSIVRMFPSIRAATVELQNLQGQMGLDVIADVTFGALSESELAFALDTAMPIGLDEPELKQWLLRKTKAQSKLYDAYEDAALYLGTPGNDVPGYIRSKKVERTKESEKIEEVKKGASRFKVEVLK